MTIISIENLQNNDKFLSSTVSYPFNAQKKEDKSRFQAPNTSNHTHPNDCLEGCLSM